jgi:prepilin signal peptidase PulO-like enzyme (type II secretory pathway)
MPGNLGFETRRGEPPYVRTARKPSLTRRFFGVVAGGIGSAAVLTMFGKIEGDQMRWAGFASLVLLVFGGVIIALVDIDTLYLDLQTMALVGVSSWGCAVVFLYANKRERDLLMGLAVVVVWVVSLEVINLIYKLMRNTDGVGFGDAVIIAATAGVPTAVSGDFMVGFFGVVCGFVIAGLVQIPLAVARGNGARTAFALGPYLCVGWIASWYVLDYTSSFGSLS